MESVESAEPVGTANLVTDLDDEALVHLAAAMQSTLLAYQRRVEFLTRQYTPVRAEVARRGLWWQMPHPDHPQIRVYHPK